MAQNAEFAALKRQVMKAGLLARQPAYYTLTICCTVAAWLAVLALLASFPDSLPVVILTGAGSGFLTMQLAFIAHDLGHNEVFRSAVANRRAGLLIANLLIGSSLRWWADSHNRHHVHPNLMDVDPETVTPLWAFSPGQAAARPPLIRRLLHWQHLTAPAAMLFGGLGLVLASAQFVRSGHERAGGIAFMVLHWVLMPAWLIWLLGPVPGLAWLALQQAVLGCYLTTVSATNHMGMPEACEVPRDFLRHQVLTSRNIIGGRLMDFLCGGLNLQIEHHLFPTMPRNRLRSARELVRPFCQEKGIGYHETTFRGALREVYEDLVAVAHSVSVADA